jgi:sulfopyruvate decarboxylase TPP-binding subunit
MANVNRSVTNSQVIYDAFKVSDVMLMSALPNTWLVHLVCLAEDDPDKTLVRLAKEEGGSRPASKALQAVVAERVGAEH